MGTVKAVSALACRRLLCARLRKFPLSNAIRQTSSGPRPPPGATEFVEGMRRVERLMRDMVNGFSGAWPFNANIWRTGATATPGSHWSLEDTYVDDLGQRKWRLTMDMSCFKPKDIEVKTCDRRLIIKAKHVSIDQREEDCTKYEYERQYTLPDGVVDVKTLTSKYTKDGRLVVEADLVEKSPGRSDGEQEIPVKHT